MEELAEAGGAGAAARPETAAGNLIDGDRLPLAMEEREEAGGGTDSAASKLFTTADNLFDRSRPSLLTEEREEASGGADSAAGNLSNHDRLPWPTEE